MSDGKRYYWLKLREDFFNSKRIKKLRKLAGGDTYTIIYLKMQLLSLKNEGCLYYTALEDDFVSELALDLDEEEDNVRITVNYLMSCGLLETSDGEEYEMPFVKECIGSETASTQRVRDFRRRQKDDKALHCNTNETKMKRVCNVEIEIEKDIDIEIEKDIEIDKDKYHCREILDYMNQVCGTHYKPTTKKTQTLIKARVKEGFTVDDFKTVIDKKFQQWHKDPKMVEYLRPETLFGTKFEGYLNQTNATVNDSRSEWLEGWTNV